MPVRPSDAQPSRSRRTSSSIASSLGPPRLVDAERGRARGRRLAVVGVVVPRPADGLAVVLEEHAVPPAGVAVEVLHQQPLAAPPLGPAGEVLPGRDEPAGRQDLEVTLLSELVHEPQRRVARGVDDLERSVDLRQRLAVGVGLQERDVATRLPQLGDPVTHRRQDQVGLLPVEGPAPEHGARLDDQQRPVVVVGEVRSQLVGEQPPGRDLIGHIDRSTRSQRSACRVDLTESIARFRSRQEPVTAWSRRLRESSSCSALTSGKLIFLSRSGSVTLLQS